MQQMPGRSADIAQSAVSARDALLLQGCRPRRPEVTVALTAGAAGGAVRPPSRHSCLLECPAAFACGALRQQHLGIANTGAGARVRDHTPANTAGKAGHPLLISD